MPLGGLVLVTKQGRRVVCFDLEEWARVACAKVQSI